MVRYDHNCFSYLNSINNTLVAIKKTIEGKLLKIIINLKDLLPLYCFFLIFYLVAGLEMVS